VSIVFVDEPMNDIFERTIETIVKLKKEGKSTLLLENEIDTKLAEIYSLTAEEIELISSAEGVKVKGSPVTRDLSDLVSP